VARFVVTGCAGFIGSHLAAALLERGDAVSGIDSFSDYYPREAKERNLERARPHEGFSFDEVDLLDADLDAIVSASDGVFHLAAQPGVRGSWGATFSVYTRDNVLVTQRVFEAAARAGTRVVFASSSSVYGDAESYPTSEDATPRPVSPYGVTKLTCEQLGYAYARHFDLTLVGLRYFSVYGPGQRPDMAFARIVDGLLTGGTFTVYGTGKQTRDFTYVGDVVDATIKAMDRGPAGAVFNIGGGSEASLSDVIDLLGSLAGRKLETRHVPAARGDVQRTAADIRRAEAELGWRPRTSLRSGIAAQLEWAATQHG